MAIDDSAPLNIKRILYSATRAVVFACLPSLVVCLIYYVLFYYRRDYLGHYAAGYGGTLCAIAAFYGAIPARRFVRWAPALLFLCVILCIAGGTLTEATVFRLAKFDEVDYCNQNLGAVLAGLVGAGPLGHDKPDDTILRGWVVVGGFFLVLGGYFAVT